MRGLLICIEGINGSGEGTNTSILTKKLGEKGYPAISVSFPDYTTPIGKEIKHFLDGKRDFSPEVRQILYAANRWERKKEIEKWLKKGKIVVANRYIPSGLAYGLANGLDLEWMINVEKGLPPADVVILIDIPVAIHFLRKPGKDIYELDRNFLENVRVAYLELAKKFDWFVVNGNEKLERVSEDVWKIATRFI
jgi:dTMP kinase